MAAPTLPPALASAADALQAAEEVFFAAVESWLMGELAAFSGRFKGRTVALYSGNGMMSLHVERRRPLAWGDYGERKAFVAREVDPDGWARWLPAPAVLAAMRQVEHETAREFVAPIGAFYFRDGAACDAPEGW